MVAIVGNEIGANNVKLAKSYTKVISSMAFCVLLLIALVLFFFRNQVVSLFTKEPAVLAITVVIFKILAFVHIPDGGQGFVQGMIRALGQQRKAAFIAIGCYYLISIPLACILVYGFDWGVIGLWYGIAAGCAS